MTWRERALCAQTDPEIWFPQNADGSAQARAICGGCPVRTECLDAATPGDHGIWGGLTFRERLRLRNDRKKEAAA